MSSVPIVLLGATISSALGGCAATLECASLVGIKNLRERPSSDPMQALSNKVGRYALFGTAVVGGVVASFWTPIFAGCVTWLIVEPLVTAVVAEKLTELAVLAAIVGTAYAHYKTFQWALN